MKEFEPISQELLHLIEAWEPKLLTLSEEIIANRRNSQNRTIKQIVGHMVDSASNNTHRIVHLQNLPSPLAYPNYASHGNNDKWIAIQHYQDENWENLVRLWKYSNMHVAHIMGFINPEKLQNEWIADVNKQISLKAMVTDYLRHFKLHLDEISQLIGV
jgi:hypothetical protein